MPLPTNVPIVRVGSSNFVGNDGVPLEGKILRLTQTELRLADGAADAIIYQVPDEATVDSTGAAWVDVPATDASVLDSQFYYSVSEPDGKSKYVIEAPSTSQVNADTGMPTVYLSNVAHIDLPYDGLAQIVQGPAGRSLIVLHRAPLTTDGLDGDGYVDTLNARLYGPKASGSWGTGTSIGGTGTTGTDGRSITSVAILGGELIVTFSDSTTQDAGPIRVIDSLAFDTATPPHLIATYSDGTTDDLGDLGLGSSGGGGAVTGAPTDLTPPAATLSKLPPNVQDQPNPLANAIMDGSPHALSTRFTTLINAQAVFPGATSLTDEIDYWAIQTVMSASRKVRLGAGTAIVHKALQHTANQEIEGEGEGVTVLKLRDGANTNVLQSADQTNENPHVTLRGFSVDGNSANNTGPIGQTDGISLVRCSDLRIENVEAHHVNGRGIHHHGLSGSIVSVQTWAHISAHDNMHWGIWNTNGVRSVDYEDIKAYNNGLRTDLGLGNTGNAADNFTGGFLLDHSEVTARGIHCWNNTQDGLWLRNIFTSNIQGVISNRNGRHGVRVLGVVDSVCDGWVVQNNGQNPALTSHNVWFDGTSSLNYGVTSRMKFGPNMVIGPNASAAKASQGGWPNDGTDYAIHLDDNMTNSDAKLNVRAYAGSVGTIRYPTAGLGSLWVDDGSGLERVERFDASGAAVQLGGINTGAWKRIVLTAACTITLPPAQAGMSFLIKLIQDSTGSRVPTLVAASGKSGDFRYTGSVTPTWTTAGGGVDVLQVECDDGQHWLAFLIGQN